MQINEANLEMSKAITEVSRATTKNAKTNTIVMYSTLLVAAVSALGTIGSFWVSYKQDQRQQIIQLKTSGTALPVSTRQPAQSNRPYTPLMNDTIKPKH